MGGDERHVLIVEDESGLIELFEIWLADEHAVSTASRGEDALTALDESIDAVVLDWRLPDLSGAAILDRIDELDLDPGVAVVTGAEPEAEGIGGRVDLVLQKPIDKAGLLTAIDDLVEGS